MKTAQPRFTVIPDMERIPSPGTPAGRLCQPVAFHRAPHLNNRLLRPEADRTVSGFTGAGSGFPLRIRLRGTPGFGRDSRRPSGGASGTVTGASPSYAAHPAYSASSSPGDVFCAAQSASNRPAPRSSRSHVTVVRSFSLRSIRIFRVDAEAGDHVFSRSDFISPRQPSSTSRQVASKSRVYHGSATSPGRSV